MSVTEQAWAFAAMAFCGAASAAVYDAIMLVRRTAHAGRFATGVLDAAFGVFLAALVTLAGLRLRIEPFRLYVLLGVLLGMLMWFVTAGTGLRTLLRLAGRRRQSVKKSTVMDEEVAKTGRK